MKRNTETAITLALMDHGHDLPVEGAGAWVPARPLGLGRGLAWMTVDERPPTRAFKRTEVRQMNKEGARATGVADPIAERRKRLPARILKAASFAVTAVTLIPAPVLAKLPPKLGRLAQQVQRAATNVQPTIDGLSAAADQFDTDSLVALGTSLDGLADDPGDPDTVEGNDPTGTVRLTVRAAIAAIAGGGDPDAVAAWPTVPASLTGGQSLPIPERLRPVWRPLVTTIARRLRAARNR